jgi:hypothetical protein
MLTPPGILFTPMPTPTRNSHSLPCGHAVSPVNKIQWKVKVVDAESPRSAGVMSLLLSSTATMAGSGSLIFNDCLSRCRVNLKLAAIYLVLIHARYCSRQSLCLLFLGDRGSGLVRVIVSERPDVCPSCPLLSTLSFTRTLEAR